jgi:hypothetical protein
MLSRSLQTLAAQLRPVIGAHAYLIGTGCAQSAYLEAQARSDQAFSKARYLCEHLALPAADRQAFARACGLGTHFVKD